MNRVLDAVRLGLCAFAFVCIPRVHAQLVLRDTFNVSTPSNDVNFDLSARQSGSAVSGGGGISYVENGVTSGGAYDDRTSVNGQLHIATGAPTGLATAVSLDHNFNETASFSIETIISPSGAPDGGADPWAAVIFGATAPHQLDYVLASDGMSIILRPNGGYVVFNSGTEIASGSFGSLADVRFDVSAAALGSSATVSLFLNGVQQDLNGAQAGLNYVRVSGFTQNYVTLEEESSPTGSGSFDELKITAVPEASPASLLAFTIVGAAVWSVSRRWRRSG